MLCLQRAVVAVEDELDEPGHERLVPLEVLRLREVRGEHEVQVSGRRMARHPGQEAMLPQKGLEILRRLGDPRRRHADVLDDERGALGLQLPHEPVHALTHAPGELDPLRLGRELDRLDQLGIAQELDDPLLGRRELALVRAAELDQERRGGGRKLLPVVRHARRVVRGGDQRGRDHQLDRARP